MSDLLPDMLVHDPDVREVARLAVAERRVVAQGSVGSSTALLAGAVARLAARPVLLVVAHVDEADDAADDLAALGWGGASAPGDLAAGGDGPGPGPLLRLPAVETLPGESSVNVDLLAQRLQVLRAAAALPPDRAAVIVAPVQALMQTLPPPAALDALIRTLRVGDTLPGGPAALVRWLDQAGYRRGEAVEEPGDFALRGGIVDVFPPGEPAPAGEVDPVSGGAVSTGGVPVRLDFFGDTLERCSEIDVATMSTDRSVTAVQLVCAQTECAHDAGEPGAFVDALPPQTLAVLHELAEVTEQARGYYERCTQAARVLGPPAVLKSLRERLHGLVLVHQYSAHAAGGEGRTVRLPVAALPTLSDEPVKALAELRAIAGQGPRHTDDAHAGGEVADVLIPCRNEGERQRLGELLAQAGGAPAGEPEPPGASEPRPGGARVDIALHSLHRGFLWSGRGLRARVIVPYHELLRRFDVRRGRPGARAGAAGGGGGAVGGARLRAERAMDAFVELSPGDFVVHTEHGIARFVGLSLMRARDARGPSGAGLPAPGTLPSPASKLKAAARAAKTGRPTDQRDAGVRESDPDAEEYLTLEFDGGARLYVPAVNGHLVQKYVGAFRGQPTLSTLGGRRWQAQKDRVREGVRDLAAQLLRVRAAREHLPGIRYPADTPWQIEFEAEFPYDETEDQLAALAEIKRDMQTPRPMDRLLCGDVGYGKTELAIRAAFKAAESGRQVAVLVPTTVLAEQHERTFRARFRDYPFRVEAVSRFRSDQQVRQTLRDVAEGRVDVVIGTHRLLSKDVAFADLGLVVIDEEQRFGVEHKERLLSLRLTADVLTLSATPIPRTLHMSMLGLRDISSLTTAPADRRAVVTEVVPPNPARLAQVLARELAREGQVYYVHNRVHDILSVADEVQKLAPDARIGVGHGQMADGELEEVMLRFTRRQIDILVCTTIIESGIDNPHANTMIIRDADRFGLADLHQLRGRVGRAGRRAYCYLLLPEDRPLKETSKKRLKAVEQFSMLGAGFKIAMRDLEIRGAGNILGPEQSGHIAAVGYDLYCQLLDGAVKDLTNERPHAPEQTQIEIGLRGLIPRAYIPSDARRLEAYRRIALAESAHAIAKVRADLADAYGPAPPACVRLLDLAEVRILARGLGARHAAVRDKDLVFSADAASARLLAARFEHARGTVTLLNPRQPGGLHEVYWRPASPGALEPETLCAILRKRLAPDGPGPGQGPAPAPQPAAGTAPAPPARPPSTLNGR